MIPVPEPSLTPDAIVERAAAMREDLRARQAETEERTFYAPETHAAFAHAGFYRILQPRRFGGYEFDVETYYRVVMELSRGCPSTGWGFCLGGAHVLQLAAFFPEDAQAAIFGADGDFVAASRDLPAGTATPVPGGYRIEGTWNYCSGAPYSTHFIARARHGEQLVLFAVGRDGWEMLDDWRGVLGMRGTGSHSIRVPGTVVPEHWVVAEDPFLGLCRREAQGGDAYRLDEDLLLESMHGQAATMAFDAIEMLVRMSGSSHAVRQGQRMERYLRDALVYRSHQQGAAVDMMATRLAQTRLEHRRAQD